jgi:NADH:ubiquinone oxidoreductase subunit 5 (subunit L)/multisubunit Na+/H+ antiporter MnhA subunit
VGTLTALVSGLTAQVRADRKGGIAGATSGTVGLLYIVLAFGYTDAALVLAGAHAVLRTLQILRAHNAILEVP